MTRFLSRILHREKPNPGRELSMIRIKNDRARIRAVAQQIRSEIGLEPLEVLGRSQ